MGEASPDFSAGEVVPAFEIAEKPLDASPDGERILIALDEADDDRSETRPRVTVVLNWFNEIEQRTQGPGTR